MPQYTEQDPQFDQDAANFFHHLIQELERKSDEINDESLITCKLRLSESARNFRQIFSHNPGQLYSHLRNGLEFEKHLICYPNEMGFGVQDSEIHEITKLLQELHKLVRQNEYENKNLQKEYEVFYLELHEFSKKQTHWTEAMASTSPDIQKHQQLMMDELQARLDQKLKQITGKRLALVDNFKVAISNTHSIQSKVLGKYLSNWKINQGKTGNGAMPMSSNTLDMIQSWCEGLADIIWNTREQIRQVSKYKKQLGAEEPNLPDYLPGLHTEITNLLMNLITSTFVIEKQPPQVMKTNTRFGSTVRLLIGNTLNIKMNSPVVKVSIVSGELR